MIAADTIASVRESSARSDAAYALSVDMSSVASEAGESSREWRPAPGELVSLWDMLRVHADIFTLLRKSLAKLGCSISDSIEKQIQLDLKLQTVRSSFPANSEVDALTKESQLSWERNRENASQLLDLVSNACTSLQLDSGLDQIERARKILESATSVAEFGSAVRELENRIEDELRRRAFFFVPPDRSKFFDEEHPFGKRVKNRFPKLTEDISEAAKCFGAGRFTASVFHLMRVLEVSVHRLALLLGTTVNVQESWGMILKPIDIAINSLPSGPKATSEENDRKAAFSQAAAYLRHVKDAWRNTTMHPKLTYTEDEARNIFEGVKMFTKSLVKLR